MTIISTELLQAMAPGFTDPTGGVIAAKLAWAADLYEINTPLRQLHWLAQLAHESSFKPQEENLRYSATRLVQVWPTRFTRWSAPYYAYNPEALANNVYSNRLGNGDESSGDGWRFRGRGYIQLTGRYNYSKFSKIIGYDIESNPDLCLQYGISSLVAAAFFKINGVNEKCDTNDILIITRAVNGYAALGLTDRANRFVKGAKFLGLKF